MPKAYRLDSIDKVIMRCPMVNRTMVYAQRLGKETNEEFDNSPLFDVALCNAEGRICVKLKGIRFSCVRSKILQKRVSKDEKDTRQEAPLERAIALVKEKISSVTKISTVELQEHADFEILWFDSIMITDLNRQFKKAFNHLDATLFYKYKNIKELAKHLVDKYPNYFDLGKTLVETPKPATKTRIYNNRELVSWCKSHQNISRSRNDTNELGTDIAVVGMSGRHPQSRDIEVFWERLKEGKDCITEIPVDRWDYNKFYDPTTKKAGTMYSKWGGFLEDIDKFDPLFFNISPREATLMDPHERVFLQEVWTCLERMGYTRHEIKKKMTNRVGVFAGISFNNYQLLVAENFGKEKGYQVDSQICGVANRVSYFFDFTGPSIPVDTACSSSLYALHLACESLHRKECKMAIAGGVNLTFHPSKYIAMCSMQAMATDGRCHAFGDDGDGYSSAESVGVVLLKPCVAAVEDGDLIYGVIKGAGVSHDGKTQGYTVPNPVSQSLAMKAALVQSKLDPCTISYVEAHGTGTPLGDPIEMRALEDVYGRYMKTTKILCDRFRKVYYWSYRGRSGYLPIHKSFVATPSSDDGSFIAAFGSFESEYRLGRFSFLCATEFIVLGKAFA